MAGLGTLATTAIITGGLTCGHGPLDPCKSGLITSPFSLYCTSELPPPKPSSGGGGYPCEAWNVLNPGEIQDFYQPVPLEYYMVPREREAEFLRRYVPVKITFKMGKYSVEKEYAVPETKRTIIVKAFNFLDVTQKQVKLIAGNIKRVAGNIKITVINFKKRDK